MKTVLVVQVSESSWAVECNKCEFYEEYDVLSDAAEERTVHKCSDARVRDGEHAWSVLCPRCDNVSDFDTREQALVHAREHRLRHRTRPLKELVRISELLEELRVTAPELDEALTSLESIQSSLLIEDWCPGRGMPLGQAGGVRRW